MKYYEHYYKGGMVPYDGVKENVKPIKKVFAELTEGDTKLSVKIDFEDKSTEELTADVKYPDDKNAAEISNIQLFWNGKIIPEEEST